MGPHLETLDELRVLLAHARDVVQAAAPFDEHVESRTRVAVVSHGGAHEHVETRGQRLAVHGRLKRFLLPRLDRLALAQRLLGELALVNVDDRADEAQEFAVGAEPRPARRLHPAIFAVGAPHAMVHNERLPLRRRFVGRAAQAFPIGVVDGLEPAGIQRIAGRNARVLMPAAADERAMAARRRHPQHRGRRDVVEGL
jgi:hypothetical protein